MRRVKVSNRISKVLSPKTAPCVTEHKEMKNIAATTSYKYLMVDCGVRTRRVEKIRKVITHTWGQLQDSSHFDDNTTGKHHKVFCHLHIKRCVDSRTSAKTKKRKR